MNKKEKNRNSLSVMMGLIGMVKPMLPIMFLAIIMGCIGNLLATFITVLGGYGMLTVFGMYDGMSFSIIFTLLVLCAVFRGILRYTEQASNHFIAFKLLAAIRHKVFASLRRLAPAKLEGSEKGNLISIITSDIELLEVFYAHTISPVAIAVITSVIMSIFIGRKAPLLGITAAVFYFIVGFVIPVCNNKRGQQEGQHYRKSFGILNTSVLDNLYGVEEIIQYDQTIERMKDMTEKSDELKKINEALKKQEKEQRIFTDGVILFSGIFVMIEVWILAQRGVMQPADGVIAVIAMMSSFGPTAALSALSNNLNQTLASGNRVLNILEEEPMVLDILEGEKEVSSDIYCSQVGFSYPDNSGEKDVLTDFTYQFEANKIHGILGKSGCGKSTLLKLMMRFFETEKGAISYGKTNVNEIQTGALRNQISYVTQDTFLFQDTIENNIKVADRNATREKVIEAAKKASIHDFIVSLPKGYDTMVAELGDSLSGGERQRIGIARAFLHDGAVIFLDEPTSNIDSLNEGLILKTLEKEKNNKTILLVSHRKSTMGIVDDMLAM